MDGQEIAEKMRKDVKKNLQASIKSTPTFKVGRFVDQQVLEKTVLSQYGKFKTNMRKADYDEKQHSQRGHQAQNTVWKSLFLSAALTKAIPCPCCRG